MVVLLFFSTFCRWLDVIEDGRRRDVMATGDAPERPTKASLKHTPFSKPRDALHAILASSTTQFGIFSFCIFFILLWAPGIFDSDPVKRNALASFVLVSMLWAGEVMPLFVTSMLIPFLAVTLRTMRNSDGERLNAEDTASYVFASMFSHVIMLLLGGFSIAAALSKHNIAKIVATSITGQCGSGTRTVLLVNQFLVRRMFQCGERSNQLRPPQTNAQLITFLLETIGNHCIHVDIECRRSCSLLFSYCSNSQSCFSRAKSSSLRRFPMGLC